MRNHEMPGARTHVGFQVLELKALLRLHNLQCEGELELLEILKKVAESYPKARPAVLDIAIPMAEEFNVTTVLL
ncbi:MAG: hypothetical protein WAW92_01885 [Minisyncoccia bacterium]